MYMGFFSGILWVDVDLKSWSERSESMQQISLFALLCQSPAAKSFVPDYFIVPVQAFVWIAKQAASFWFTMQTPIVGTRQGMAGSGKKKGKGWTALFGGPSSL